MSSPALLLLGREWLATDHVTWVLSELNTMQQDTLLLCPNAVVNITNEMVRKRKIFNFGMVKRLVLRMPLNVGKENGQTFIGTMNKSGNHRVLVVVEIRPFKRMLYCDTLAWKPPSDIIDVVNSYISHIPRIEKYDDTHLFLAHHSMATSRFGHMCDWRCRNYPLQTCSDVCGVIVLIIAALAALDRPLFQFLIGPSEKSQVYLQRPSQHAYFLRRIIMCWFAESRIEINYVLLHHDWRYNVRSESDHSSCLRRDTSSSTRKKLKLSLNPKASSSNGSIPRATEEHASAKECSSPSPAEDFPVNTAQVSSGSSSIPNSPMSSEETFSPPPKTPSSPNDSCAVPSCKKGSQGPQLTSYRVQKSLSLLRAQIQLVLHRTMIHKLVHKLTLLRRASPIPNHLPVPDLRLRLQHQRNQLLKGQLPLIPLTLIQLIQYLLPTLKV